MNIRGTEGLTPADIQSEIARGARFVAYEWCVSLLVVTFKRSSRIHYLKPGDAGFRPSFLWSLCTLVAGWWGFPWGPIHSLSSLWTNLRGGIDVTSAVSADLANTQGAPALPPLVEAPAAGSRWSTAPLAAVGLVIAGILGTVSALHYYDNQHMPVALANGLDAAYTVEIDGQPHHLRPHSVTKLELPEGQHVATATLPGGTGESRIVFTVAKATVVNPDAAALVVEESTYYTAESKPKGDNPAPKLHCGRTFYNLPKPDFFLLEFPSSIQMPSNSGRATRTRLAVYAEFTIDRVAEIVLGNSGRPALATYLGALGQHLPANQTVLDTAAQMLEPAEAKAFFAAHLATRPVLVEWHRAYQNSQRAQNLDSDLLAEYARLAEADPDEGAFAYLYGRLLDNSIEDSAWFQRALAAKRPCAYAHFALAYNAAARGDFSGALADLDRANRAGLDNENVRSQRIECLLALGLPTEALQELRQKPAAQGDFARAAEELRLAYLAGGRPAAKQVIDTFIGRLPAETRKESGSDIRKTFETRLAYYEGDAKTYGESIPADATGFAAVTRALCLGDHDAALRATDACPDSAKSVAYLLLYLALSGEKAEQAETCWKLAWDLSSKRHARLAAHFAGTARLTDAELLDFPLNPNEKRLILTAIGLHEPKLRAAAFARAAQCNFNREFPHHLVAAALATAKR